MMKDEEEESEHVHAPVNAKTYCAKSKAKWLDLREKARELENIYEDKVKELGSLCASLFNNYKEGDALPGDENREKGQAVKRFVEDVAIALEKADAFQTEARADLMTQLNQKLQEYEFRFENLKKMIAEMEVAKVIEESFTSKEHRTHEESVIQNEKSQ